MREYQKQHENHRRRDEAWHQSYGAETRTSGFKFRRRFATRDEQIARLGTYLSELRSEAQAVEEQIATLEAASNS